MSKDNVNIVLDSVKFVEILVWGLFLGFVTDNLACFILYLSVPEK